jgi:uncharacterized membrane protein YidH (DUF202 family)
MQNRFTAPLRKATNHRHSRLSVSASVVTQQRVVSSSFWKSQTVENTGSIARDILATERTFLAWARTGLGFCGAGSALAAAYHREGYGGEIYPASALLIGNGVFLLAFATRRYWNILHALRQDKFVINPGETLVAVAITAVATMASLGYVFELERSSSLQHKSSSDDSSSDDDQSKKKRKGRD